jgi:hypothetical protein
MTRYIQIQIYFYMYVQMAAKNKNIQQTIHCIFFIFLLHEYF